MRGRLPRERHKTVPSWVTPTQWPPDPSATSSHPSTKSARRCGALVYACGVEAPPWRTGRGPRSEGCQQWDHPGNVPSLQCRRGDCQSGAAAPYRQLRASWSAGPDTARPWGTRCSADSTHQRSAPIAIQWGKHPMRMSSRQRWQGSSPRGRGGARDVSEGGEWGRGGEAETGGGELAGTPLLLGSPMVPAEGRPKILKLKSSWHRRHRSKILAVSLKHWKGRRGGGGGGGRALLERRGEGGRRSRGGGEGVQGGGAPPPPPSSGMNHINRELQKCTTLTHSAYTFVIMSEHR